MREMLIAVVDSFLRALIRFWDNRFIRKNDYTEIFREEISSLRSRNRELTDFIFNALAPKVSDGNARDDEEEAFEQMGRPIESMLNRRKRLERESLAEWNRMVQEAREAQIRNNPAKTTEEIEKEVGIN